MSMAPLVLTVDRVHKKRGKRQVLRGASFTAHAGESLAILGENGCGKSTLLGILAGALSEDGGRVERAGSVGYCPQECLLYPQLTPDEHMVLFGEAYRVSRGTLSARADELFDELGFARARGQVVEELSGGTRQKLNLALALLHDPAILLLDEPYAGFDVETYRQFLAWSDRAKGRGRCIVVVTHIAFEPSHFDRIFRLADGMIHVEAS